MRPSRAGTIGTNSAGLMRQRGWFGLGGDDAGSGSSSSDCRVATGNGKGRKGHASSGASVMREHERQRAHGHGLDHVHAHGHLHIDIESWGGDRGIHEHENGGEEADSGHGGKDAAQRQVGRRRQVVGVLMREMGIMLHSLVIGFTLAITSGPESTLAQRLWSLRSCSTSYLKACRSESGSRRYPRRIRSNMSKRAGENGLLKPVLALMFAVTTPVGIAIGLAVFGPGESEGVILLMSVMSALSAGMLIYAACIEMLGETLCSTHICSAPSSAGGLSRCG
ncbi:uncharacterized protein LAESUDRAFT_316494 [Laetiporus sulphureus 93-53]|uniref:Zinc/iron permease n=1 Tax=Laetiporus sulphureus 93-53 TaxID=1314785 RepID=A0A165D2T1_9APHY|nr:uncharacterized protein LAESUDRAFT_316494 [Laetiporus sulphureus 93-53]KZT04046.1 hypothetical protein LAESUDRAFT_316494 [Laetiporus sulphureus 93-53]